MRLTLGLSVGQLGQVLSISKLVRTLSLPGWGYAADHFSRKALLVGITGLWGLWTVAIGFVGSLSQEKLRKSQDKQVLVEVFVFEQEWDEAIEVAEGRNVWYPVVETVADGVMDHRPDWVARASIKHAERLMVEPKSKNYPIAAGWLKRANGKSIWRN